MHYLVYQAKINTEVCLCVHFGRVREPKNRDNNNISTLP